MIRNPIRLGSCLMLLVMVSVLSGCAGAQLIQDSDLKRQSINRSVEETRNSVLDEVPTPKKAEIYALCDEALAVANQAMWIMTAIGNHIDKPWLVGDPGVKEWEGNELFSRATYLAEEAQRLAEAAKLVVYQQTQQPLGTQRETSSNEAAKPTTTQPTSPIATSGDPAIAVAVPPGVVAGLTPPSEMADAVKAIRGAASLDRGSTTVVGNRTSPTEINSALNVVGPVSAADIAIAVDQDMRLLDVRKESEIPKNTVQTQNFPWIDAGNLTLVANIPTSGLATYNGQLSGNSTGPGGITAVSGTINLSVDFAALQTPATPAINATLTFNNGMGSASGVLTNGALGVGSNGLAGTFRGEGIITGALRNSSFYGPSANELGGNWDVQTISNTGSGNYKSAR